MIAQHFNQEHTIDYCTHEFDEPEIILSPLTGLTCYLFTYWRLIEGRKVKR